MEKIYSDGIKFCSSKTDFVKEKVTPILEGYCNKFGKEIDTHDWQDLQLFTNSVYYHAVLSCASSYTLEYLSKRYVQFLKRVISLRRTVES
jgi:hypothetical protein